MLKLDKVFSGKNHRKEDFANDRYLREHQMLHAFLLCITTNTDAAMNCIYEDE